MIYRLSFRRRIWMAFMLIVVLAVTAAGWLSYRIAADVVEKNAYRFSQTTLSKTSQVLDEKLNRIMSSVYSMMVNTAYRRALGFDSNFTEVENYYTHLSALQATFVQTRLYEPIIHTILVATPEGDYYQTSQSRLFESSFYDSPLYERIKREQRKLWFEGHDDAFFSGRERVVSFVMEGIPANFTDDIYVVANVKEQALKELVLGQGNGEQGQFLLATRDGTDVLRSDSPLLQELTGDAGFLRSLGQEQGYFDYVSEGKDYLVRYARLKSFDDWTLFSILPKSDLFKQMDSIKWTIIAIISGCVLVSFAFSDMLTRLLLKPLNRLQYLMKKVEMNDLSVRYESEFEDEISQLGYRFNRMLEELGRLFREVQEAEQEKSKSEMKALQAQIDPHFLYNTLNTIYWKSQTKHLADVQDMVLSLSKLFQLGLNKGKELTPLGFELMHVEQYLKIQRQCYEQLFDYEIEVDPGVDQQQSVPKILLQPLAENAILHGFKNRTEGGRIRIRAEQDDRQLRLIVEDNGEGMQLPMQLSAPAEGQPLKGYALYNVQRRLQLQYSGKASLTIYSQKSMFTKITIAIPRGECDDTRE